MTAILVAHDRLNRKIETALNETAPGANRWPSSPSPGYMNFGDAWHDDSSGVDIFTPKPLKAYDLLAPGIWAEFAQDGDIWRITLSAEKPAFFEAIEADVPGRFPDNAFTLFPGHAAEVTFKPNDGHAMPSFTLRDLHSATYGSS